MGPLGLPCSPALAALSTSPAPASASSSSRLPPCRPPIFSLGRKLRRFRSELRCSTSSTVSDIDSSSSGLGSSPASSSDASERTKNDIDAQVFVSRYEADEPRKGCDVLVEALERAGVDTVFAYPGGASMEIHQALTRTDRIRNILCRHEQGEIFAAEGYAKSSGRVGVCIATSGPGATNLVTGLADAMLDSVPLVAITGQVPRAMIGTDAFQETPIVEITRPITKHNYLVMRPEDIPRVIEEAFALAQTGRPGPVLVDIPKDIQQTVFIPDWNQKPQLDAYRQRLPPTKVDKQALQAIMRAIQTARRPIIYCGGGCIDAQKELRDFVDITGIPVTSTLMGLGTFPAEDERCLQMLGMHGTVYANYAIDKSDLLLAFGVRFDDRVTGKLEAFAQHARIVHIDIDPAEIGKNKLVDVEIHGDVKIALRSLNTMLKRQDYPFDYSQWMSELQKVQESCPMVYTNPANNGISAQRAIETLCEITKGNAIISTGVGQHQMWSAQWYKFPEPRRWVTSGGLGSMGFGLPSAIGAQAANPDAVVVDIDGDGSFVMNIQELATLFTENLPVKVMVLNNQHLGMVVQWEDRFYKANRAHTYLGDPSKSHERVFEEKDIYPDFITIARGFNVPAARISHIDQLEDGIHNMLNTPGPYLLDVIVPFQDHVLPMIPGGGSFKDIITTGSGDDFQ